MKKEKEKFLVVALVGSDIQLLSDGIAESESHWREVEEECYYSIPEKSRPLMTVLTLVERDVPEFPEYKERLENWFACIGSPDKGRPRK